MRNAHLWTPSKFSFDKSGQLHANSAEVPTGSLMIADLTARWWQGAITEHLGGDVLDLGCGLVPLYEAYSPQAASVTCVDWNRNPYLDAVVDLNEPIDLPSASFDSVILSDVLEHVRNPEQLLAEVFRLLRPEGAVLLNTPFYYWLHEEPHDYCRYTEFWLRARLEEAGFSEIRVDPLGGYAEVFTDLLAKGLTHTTKVPSALAVAIQRFTLKVGETRRGSGLRARTARKIPLSYGTTATKSTSPDTGSREKK